MSNEHKIFLKKKKRKKICIVCWQLLIIITFILIWQLLANFNIINTFISSSPKDIYLTIVKLFNDGTLFNNIWVTVYETIISFGLGTLIGIVIATILWWNNTLAKILDPYLTVLNSLPKVALGPIIIIWVGASINSIILMALLVSMITSIINIYNAFTNTDQAKVKLLKTFNATKYQIFKKVIFPSNTGNIISTLKINISLSLIGVIMGEFLVSKQGIGYLIIYGSQVFNLNLVMTGIILLGIVSAVMYYLLVYIEKRLVKF